MSTSTKRRKISNDVSADVVPSTVLSTPPAPPPGVGGIPEGVKLLKPELGDIHKLVVYDLLKDDPDDVAEAMKNLFDSIDEATPNGGKYKAGAIALGAIAAIVRTMTKWQMHEGIQQWGCGCMMRFAFKNIIQFSKEGRFGIIISGGIEAAINAMMVFPESVEVQRRGSAIFRNVFGPLAEARLPPEVLPLSNRFVENLQGVELLVKASKKFPDQAMIQEHCCCVFKNLALNKEFKGAMKKAGVLGAVAAAMENHSEDKEIQKYAEAFMKNFVK